MAKAQATDDAGTIEVPLTEATHQQLIWFCKEHGYEWSEMETQSQTYARVKAAWPHPTITVPAVIEEEVSARPRAADDTAPEDRYGLPPTVRLKILSLGDEAETEMYLAHNGTAYRIQTGQEVELPWYVFKGCILDAQQIRYRSDSDLGLGDGQVTQAVAFQRLS